MKATISYTLDDAGRRASLIAGGDGLAAQTMAVEIAPADLDLMDMCADGSLTADARYKLSSYSLDQYFFALPSAAELLSFLRARSLRTAQALEIQRIEQSRKDAEKAALQAKKRVDAIAELRKALADGRVIQPVVSQCSYISFSLGGAYYDGVNLSTDDPEVGAEVAHMLELAKVEREQKSQREARLRVITAVPEPKIRPTTLESDGTYSFTCPAVSGDKQWAKHLESIDRNAKDGFAFCGSWLRSGDPEMLAAGELVIVGASNWVGSRKNGRTEYTKALFVVTPAGLVRLCLDEQTKPIAIKYLALDPAARVAKALADRAKIAREHIETLEALDRTEYAGELAELDARLNAWQNVLTACAPAESAGKAKTKAANALAVTVDALLRAIDTQLAELDAKAQGKARRALIAALRDANKADDPAVSETAPVSA